MNVDIRQYTRVIIRKNNVYLQGRSSLCGNLVWSTSPWDAWWTRNAEDARNIARVIGGIPVLFNPISKRTAIL